MGFCFVHGNDSAVALAEHIGGSIQGFADLMNKKAEELGLENTHFVTPHGLDEDMHYTTAFELAILADYGLKNEKFKQIVRTHDYTVTINNNGKSIHNTNELLGNLNGVYGVKTGFTNGANRCLVTSVKRNNMDIICVVLGADTKKFRTQDSVKLIEYVFENYKIINIKEKIEKGFNAWKDNYQKDTVIIKGKQQEIDVQLGKIKIDKIPVLKEKENQIDVLFEGESVLYAPIEKNKPVGKCTVMLQDTILEEMDIYITKEIDKKGIMDYLNDFISNYPAYLQETLKI